MVKLLLYFGTCGYLFSPDERPCYIFLTQNNYCEFLTSYSVIVQSAIQSYLTQTFMLTNICVNQCPLVIYLLKSSCTLINCTFSKKINGNIWEKEKAIFKRHVSMTYFSNSLFWTFILEHTNIQFQHIFHVWKISLTILCISTFNKVKCYKKKNM